MRWWREKGGPFLIDSKFPSFLEGQLHEYLGEGDKKASKQLKVVVDAGAGAN